MKNEYNLLLTNQTQPQIPPLNIKICGDFVSRLRGFMFTKSISADQGLILKYDRESTVDSSIHMFFMNFNLAVFWLNKDRMIVDKTLAYKWQPYYASKIAAQYVLEGHPDLLEQYHIHDRLFF